MEVLIAGGHGKVALALTRRLSARGDRVRSLIRDPAQVDDIRAAGGQPVLHDLERDTEAGLFRAVAGARAIVFAAGAGPGSGPERKETVDYGGAVKAIRAARAASVARFVMVSTIGADPDASDERMGPYLRAKGRADRELRESGLEYTIVRPGRLTDDPGRGRVQLAWEVQRGDIPREDVAAVLAALLPARASIGRTLGLVGGNDAIESAVDSLQ